MLRLRPLIPAISWVLLSLALSSPALADGQGVPPPPSDPAARQRTAQKIARIQAAAAVSGGVSVFTSVTGQPRAAIAGDTIGPDYAELVMTVWEEPQDSTLPRNPANYCGPGSTSGVVSRWAAMRGQADPVATYPGGKDPYQVHLAVDLNEQEQVCWDPVSQAYIWCTTFPGMFNVTNSAASTNGFYGPSGTIGTLSHYILLLRSDLHDTNVPLIPVVWTAQLPGWNGRGVTHWTTVKQYWESGNTTTYGDTAGPIQQYTNPYGWHVVNLDFYYQQIQAAYDQVVW